MRVVIANVHFQDLFTVFLTEVIATSSNETDCYMIRRLYGKLASTSIKVA